MAVLLTSISPEKVLADGGAKFSVFGDFTGMLGTGYRVHIGPNGDSTDPACYSGVVGQGTTIYPVSVQELRCYLPVLEPTDGSPYDVFVVQVLDALENGVLAGALEVLPAQYYSRVFNLRSVFPPFYRMGPRNMSLLEPLP